MSLLDQLPHTFKILRRSYILDESGGDVAAETLLATAIPGWFQSATAKEILEYQKKDVVVTHKIYVQTAQDVETGDILVALDGPYEGQRCDFKGQAECTAGLDWGWKIMVENKR